MGWAVRALPGALLYFLPLPGWILDSGICLRSFPHHSVALDWRPFLWGQRLIAKTLRVLTRHFVRGKSALLFQVTHRRLVFTAFLFARGHGRQDCDWDPYSIHRVRPHRADAGIV